MKQTFTKKDLLTGDIIEARNGDRGVVILEKDCILYQGGGLDELDVFTEDLFIDGPCRDGDIFKVYRDPEGPIGFRKLFDAQPVFRRVNDRQTKERSAELSEKYDRTKGKYLVAVLEPFCRRCERMHIDLKNDQDFDLTLSEAPSMTVCGQIKIDRTYIRIPDTENLFLIYNKYQEERHLKQYEERKVHGHPGDADPIVIIPEENIEIHSRCLLVRLGASGEPENLQEDDLEKAWKYIFRMRLS